MKKAVLDKDFQIIKEYYRQKNEKSAEKQTSQGKTTNAVKGGIRTQSLPTENNLSESAGNGSTMIKQKTVPKQMISVKTNQRERKFTPNYIPSPQLSVRQIQMDKQNIPQQMMVNHQVSSNSRSSHQMQQVSGHKKSNSDAINYQKESHGSSVSQDTSSQNNMTQLRNRHLQMQKAMYNMQQNSSNTDRVNGSLNSSTTELKHKKIIQTTLDAQSGMFFDQFHNLKQPSQARKNQSQRQILDPSGKQIRTHNRSTVFESDNGADPKIMQNQSVKIIPQKQIKVVPNNLLNMSLDIQRKAINSMQLKRNKDMIDKRSNDNSTGTVKRSQISTKQQNDSSMRRTSSRLSIVSSSNQDLNDIIVQPLDKLDMSQIQFENGKH